MERQVVFHLILCGLTWVVWCCWHPDFFNVVICYALALTIDFRSLARAEDHRHTIQQATPIVNPWTYERSVVYLLLGRVKPGFLIHTSIS